jgi:GABA permease
MTTSPTRTLVVANETVPSDVLPEMLGRDDGREVLVIAPALNGRLAHWSSDDRRARREAEQRLARCLDSLRAGGLVAHGRVGDADPLLAIDDALRVFPANEIVIATHPEGQSNWLARNIVSRARSRYAVPVHHLVVDSLALTEFLAA